MFRKLLSSVVASALGGSLLVASEIQIGGFASVVAGISDIDRDTDTSVNKSFPGYVDTLSFQPDSLFGLQFNADITENMGAVAQIRAKYSDFDQMVTLEWGYAYFDLNDELRLIVGRYRPAVFMYSTYLDVGYAYPWITLPSVIYMHSYLTNVDGLNANYKVDLGGDMELGATLYGGTGQSALEANDGLPIRFDDLIGGELILHNDFVRIRGGYAYALASVDYEQMADLNGDGQPDLPTSGPIYEELKLDRSPAQLVTAGLRAEYAGAVVIGEYFVQMLDKTVFNRIDAWYATVGYQIGDFLPHYTYSRSTSHIDEYSASTPEVNAIINGARTAQLENTINNTVGLRYDINAMAAVKAEWTGTTNQDLARYGEKEEYNVYKLALNIIF